MNFISQYLKLSLAAVLRWNDEPGICFLFSLLPLTTTEGCLSFLYYIKTCFGWRVGWTGGEGGGGVIPKTSCLVLKDQNERVRFEQVECLVKSSKCEVVWSELSCGPDWWSRKWCRIRTAACPASVCMLEPLGLHHFCFNEHKTSYELFFLFLKQENTIFPPLLMAFSGFHIWPGLHVVWCGQAAEA